MKKLSEIDKSQLLEKLQKLESENKFLRKTLRQHENNDLGEQKILPDHFQSIAQLGCWIYDKKNDLFNCSDEAFRLFGYQPGSVVPRFKHFIDRVHPDDVGALLTGVEKSMDASSSTIHEVEYRVVINGEIRYLSSKFKVQFDDAGNAIKRFGTTIDITKQKAGELELLRTRQLHESAQKLANLGHWELNFADGNTLYWSDQVYKIFELEKEKFEPSYENFINVIHPEDREALEKVFSYSVDNRTQYKFVHRLLMQDGAIKYVQEIGKTYYDANGVAIKTIGTVQDITEIHKAKRALQATYSEMKLSLNRRSNDLARLSGQVQQGAFDHIRLANKLRVERDFNHRLIEIAPVIVLVMDNDGKILHFNPYLAKLTGYSLSEVKGKSWFDTFIYQDDHAPLKRLFGKSIAGMNVKGNVNPVKCKQGKPKMIEWWSSTIKDEAGEISGLLSIGQDITDSLHLLGELETERLMLRTLIEESSSVICYKSRQGIWLEANQEMLNLWGVKGKKYKGLSNQQIIARVTPNLREALKLCISWEESVWESGQPITQDLTIPQSNGLNKVYQVTKKLIRNDNDQAEALLVIGHEITQRESEKNKRIKEMKVQKNALVREVHHRIKNHLQGLVGLLALHKPSNSEFGPVIDEIITQINSIGTVYGLQSQTSSSNIHLFDMLTAIIENAEKTGDQVIYYSCAEPTNEYEVDTNHAVPVSLIVNELVMNALKHAGDIETGQKLDISCDTGDDYVLIRIVNAGVLPKDFDFNTSSGLGTGLELVQTMLPSNGATLKIYQQSDNVITELRLVGPLISISLGPI